MRFIFILSFLFMVVEANDVWAQTSADEASVEPAQFSTVYKIYTKAFQSKSYREALIYAEEAYVLGKEKFGSESETFATLALNLGTVYRHLNESKKAIPYLKDAREILEDIHGKNHINLLDVYMEMAAVYLQQYKTSNAKTVFKNVKKIVQKEYGEQSQLLFSLTLEIARLFVFYDKPHALDYLEETIELGKAIYPEGHYLIGYASFSAAKIYMGGGSAHRKKAEEYFLEALNIYEKTPPPSLQFIVITHGLLTQLYTEMGYDDKATFHCVAVGKIRGDHDLNEYQALYKNTPKYPSSEYNRKTDGVVVVEYDVDAEGRVINPVVLQSSSNAFSKALMSVVTDWRYAPRVVDGVPIITAGVRTRMTFQVEN